MDRNRNSVVGSVGSNGRWTVVVQMKMTRLVLITYAFALFITVVIIVEVGAIIYRRYKAWKHRV
jgi:hypothetical protein